MVVSETKKRNNRKYDEKTYKRVIIRLRIEEDADLITSFEEAQKKGMTGREWLRTLNREEK